MVWTPTSGGKELTTYLSYLYKSYILVNYTRTYICKKKKIRRTTTIDSKN